MKIIIFLMISCVGEEKKKKTPKNEKKKMKTNN